MSINSSNKRELRKFIISASIFGCILISLVTLTELYLRSRPSSYSIKAEYLRDHGSEISTLILGSSHTYYGLNPKWIGDSCFNLANISQTPELDYELLKKNIAFLPNLRRVIIPISYFTFTDLRLEDSEEWFLCINYKIHMRIGENLSNFSKYNFTFSHFPSFTARIKNALKIESKENRCDSLGFGLGYTLDNRDPNWESTAARRVANLTRKDSKRRKEVRECLDAMLNFCKEKNIKAILIVTPVWREFRKYADTTQLSLMRMEAKELAKRHNLVLIDLFDSAEFTSEDFFDTDHLSIYGAERLSKIVSKEIHKEERPSRLEP